MNPEALTRPLEEVRSEEDVRPHKLAGEPDLSDPVAASLWTFVPHERPPDTRSRLDRLRSENAGLKAQIERSREETERLRRRVHDLLVKLRAGELQRERMH